MRIEVELAKNQIEVIRQLDSLTVYKIAAKIARKLATAYADYSFNENAIFDRLSSLTMYIARMPEGMAEANYFYKNSSVYFNDLMDLSQLDSFAMHECIHSLQEVKNARGKLLRLGLCDFSVFSSTGMGLNEAAVQLATCKAMNAKEDTVKYYGITLSTISPSYYPIECSLVAQMAYLTGEHVLIESTFYSDHSFQDYFISLTSKKAYETICQNLDRILDLETKLITLNQNLVQANEEKQIQKIANKIDTTKKEIHTLYFATQNLIITSYFDKAFLSLSTTEELEAYRTKLYTFQDFLGTTEDYSFFNSYYIDKMAQLDMKYHEIENGITSLVVWKENKLVSIFRSLRKLLGLKEKNIVIEK